MEESKNACFMTCDTNKYNGVYKQLLKRLQVVNINRVQSKIIYFLIASIIISCKYHSYWKFAEIAIKIGGFEDIRRAYLDIQR